MIFQGLKLQLSAAVLLSLVGCASTSSVTTNTPPAIAPVSTVAAVETAKPEAPIEITRTLPKKASVDNYLICKASKKRFHYDWSAGTNGQGLIDQNNIRYEFRSASKPAGDRGENLKVGECGWAGEALAEKTAAKTRKSQKSQVVFNSLSDEVTQTFYKMKTGKVFRVPVRQTKNGLIANPGGVSVIR
ncbi:MAG: hypothetical protein JSU04_08950 [Bdellovibrionales bacterium]|nr:hypothetical protein [Bdellovibrionales bacterium]